MDVCFECGDPAAEKHHVVPVSAGGTKTVPLCSRCHGLVHSVERLSISTMTKAALKRAKDAGVKLGNPNGAQALRRAAKGNTASLESIKAAAENYAEALRPHIETMATSGTTSLGGIARKLSALGIKSPRGGVIRKAMVKNVLLRLEARV